MKRMCYCLLLVAVVCGSCGDQQAGNAMPGALGKVALFNVDSVRHFIALTPEAQRDSSQKVFLKALDLLKNKNKPAASVALFLEALAIYPNATTYYELGNAWLDNNNPEQALDAYKMAELMDYSPWSHVLFKKACCLADKEESEALDYLSYAIENGYVDRNKIFSNPHFARYKEGDDDRLLSVYNAAMAGNGDADAILWEGYSKQFGQASFPFSIDSGTLTTIGKPVLISYDYEKYVTEMRDHKFSRDVGNEFFYFTKVNDSPGFKTVIYGSKSYEGDLIPAYYLLASFTKSGRLIDKKLIGGTRALDEPFKECSFTSGNSFEIKEYKNTYEKDVAQEGYDDNKIIKRDLVSTNQFKIDSTGKFIAAL